MELNLPKKITAKKFIDTRGYFQECFKEKKFKFKPVFSAISFSKQKVIRGLHFQNKFKQKIFITVLVGKIFDVCVDIDFKSKNFSKIYTNTLQEGDMLYIPLNFAHGFAPFCVSIALWVDGAPKVAVVLEVAHNELFSAMDGEGAWLNEKPIAISSISDPAKSLVATGFPYSQFDLVDPYLAVLKNLMQKTHGIRRAGAASYDLCCVAAGRVEGFYEYGLSP